MTPMTITSDVDGLGVTVTTDTDQVLITPRTLAAFVEIIASGELIDLQVSMRLAQSPCHHCGDRPSVGLDECGAPRCQVHEDAANAAGWDAS